MKTDILRLLNPLRNNSTRQPFMVENSNSYQMACIILYSLMHLLMYCPGNIATILNTSAHLVFLTVLNG